MSFALREGKRSNVHVVSALVRIGENCRVVVCARQTFCSAACACAAHTTSAQTAAIRVFIMVETPSYRNASPRNRRGF